MKTNKTINTRVQFMTINDLFGENSGIEFVPVSEEEKEELFKSIGNKKNSDIIREDDGKEIDT